ncbi:MAG: hypothetical protein PHG32_06870 [Candidatus Cloacimonetes bacterium]|nr:hypothetical protein [Candidatus Cloacimonadota bacterium]HPH61289.1 hypothetical protein [Candidatus Syntrophosphaera sp.]
MKATRANLLGEFTGKLDNLIYYRRKPGGKIYVRKQFTFKNHPGQPGFAGAQKAIYALKPSPAYQRDLKDYLILYNQLPDNAGKNAQAWTNVYNKLMFAMQKKLGVQLKTITRAQIEAQNLPCRTVKAAVEAGLLPEVRDFERLTKPI